MLFFIVTAPPSASIGYYTNIPASLVSEGSQNRMVPAENTLAEGIEMDFVQSVLLGVYVENGDLPV